MRPSSALLPLLSCTAILVSCTVPLENPLASWTGEESLPGQIRGMLQLAGNPLHAQPDTARYSPVAHAGVNPFGINVFLEQEVEDWKRERVIQMVAQAGFHWIQQQFPWEDIEYHGKGDFVDRRNDMDGDGQIDAIDAWGKYDHIVDLTGQYGLEVIARLGNPPAWSRADGSARGTLAPPDDLQDFGDYVDAVVSHYRGRIRYYQIWNEPNIYPEWGEQPVDPEGYTQLLCLAYQRAKEADPDAVIISGALAQTKALSGRDLSDLVFLQRMYDAGAGECFDVLSVNDYILWSGPTDRRMHPPEINFARPLYIRDLMVANGDAAKALWISEMNANALPNDPQIQDWGRFGQVTLDQQARYAPQAYQRVMEEWPWVGAVNFWFFKRPSDTESNQSWYYFRMAEPDFVTLPVYDAMQAYIAGLTPTLYAGTHQEDHWALAYEGAWETVSDERAVLGTYRRAESPGAQLSFTFEGNILTWTPGPGDAEIQVTIDERPPERYVLDGRTLRLWSAPTRAQHRVHVVVLAGQAGVDSLTVRQPDWGRRAVIGALVLGVLVSLLYLTRRRRAE